MKKEIIIEGMSCGHCSARVDNVLSELSGVTVESVNLETKTATVALTGEVTDAVIREAIEDAGYDVIEIK